MIKGQEKYVSKNTAKLIAELCSLNRMDNEKHDVECKVNEHNDSTMTFKKKWDLALIAMVKNQLLPFMIVLLGFNYLGVPQIVPILENLLKG